jgi:hypothetical protein
MYGLLPRLFAFTLSPFRSFLFHLLAVCLYARTFAHRNRAGIETKQAFNSQLVNSNPDISNP